MDVRSLILFQHLAASLHFGKTASAMHVSPSTLSRSIQRLEDEAGAVLFSRDNRSVRLTAAGEKVLRFADKLVTDWHSLQHQLGQHTRELSGAISLYCSVTASQSHLPPLLERFRQRYPGIDIKLHTGDPGLSVNKVLAREVDVALAIHTPDFPLELSFLPLDRIPLELITPKETQLNRLSQIEWQQHSVVLPDSGPAKRIIHHWFAEHGIRPRVYASVAGNEAIVSMVALGCGLGFAPQAVLEHSTLGSKVNRILVDDIEPYSLGLCCLRQRSEEPIIAALLQQAPGEGAALPAARR